MPFAKNGDVQIYYEVEGRGPPLVIMHGAVGSIQLWRHLGLVQALMDDYRLILIDTRGHGLSDKPHDPAAYAVASLVGDVVAVLDDLRIARAHYFGYSMGGMIGLGIPKHAPDRFYSLILGGTGLPVERDPQLPSNVLEAFNCTSGMGPFLITMEAMFGKWWTPEVQAIAESNDLDALSALLTAEEGILSTGLEDVLPNVTIPCLFYVGEGNEDEFVKVKEIARRVPNSTFVSLPNLDHPGAGCRTDLVLPHVRRFLAEVGEG
jgi:pimeloyl-ACP methyl ester carboxylesterase